MTNNKNVKKILSSRKFKYGSSAVVFTAVFVAFIILANVLLSFIDVRNGGLYFDMTSKKLYGVSEASIEALKGTDKPIEIIFCQPSDKIAEYDVLNPIKMLAENYEKAFKNVKVVYKDRLSDPVYFNQFIKTSADQINTSSIIVNCPSTGLSTIYGWENMYKYNTDGNLFAFDGENKLTTAILSIARNDENVLKAGLVTGHGESADQEMRRYLEDYGYAVSNVDLKTISDEELASYNLLLVCNPVSDFIGMSKSELSMQPKEAITPEVVAQAVIENNAPETAPEHEEDAANVAVAAETAATDEQAVETAVQPADETQVQAEASELVQEAETEPEQVPTPDTDASSEPQGVNEIQKLYRYVVEDFGNVMFFFDPHGRDLPELFSLCYDGFGVQINNLYYVADMTTTIQSADGSMRFIGEYDTIDTDTAGYNLHKPISETQAGYPPAFGLSCLMNIPKKNVGSFEMSPVISGSQNTLVVTGESEPLSVPYAPLVTLSRYAKIVDNKEKKANVIICGSTGFVSELDNPSFANADLFKQILVSTGNDNIVADIDFKVLDESSIEVTDKVVDGMTRKLVIIIPVIVAVIGAVVFIKRKYL